MNKQYGRPFLLSGLGNDSEAAALSPLPYVTAKGQDSDYNENWLQELIASHPEILPFNELGEPTFATATSVCTELPVSGKYLDNLLVTDRGGIVLIECKLWRNPEANRAVIGQILDYATELSKWNYQTLNEAIQRARPAQGAKESSLYERVGSSESLSERDFIDEVNRNLRRGRFLLMVVGDGIRERMEAMASFLQSHAGLHFTLGLAEMAVFQLPEGRYLVQPRVLARTVMIERGVVVFRDERIEIQPSPDLTTAASQQRLSLRTPATISEEMMFAQLEAKEIGLGGKLQDFLRTVEPMEVFVELTPTSMKLIARANDNLWPLALIDPKNGTIWFDSFASTAKAAGRYGDALTLYKNLVNFIEDENLRREKLKPGTKNGVRSLPLSPLLKKPELWAAEIDHYLKAVSIGTSESGE
jgi:hypothetical protein